MGMNCIGLVNEGRGYKKIEGEFLIVNKNLVVPGDLVFWYIGGTLTHVVIITSIEYDGENREVKEENITVIHQTTWSENWFTQKIL